MVSLRQTMRVSLDTMAVSRHHKDTKAVSERRMKPQLSRMTLRLPRELQTWLAREATINHRSVNGEVVACVEAAARKGGERPLSTRSLAARAIPQK